MKRFLWFLLILALSLPLGLWAFLYLTIPARTTFHSYSDLKGPVDVEWDKAGIPIIQSADIHDAYFVQGYLTARDRFFQMELTRRKMSGTLAELFGPKALSSDLSSRRWNYKTVATLAFEQMDSQKREPLIAYANGVNSFLQNHSPSWEFWILGVKPSPWRPEDTFLTVLSMYESLNRQSEPDEQVYSLLRSRLSVSTLSFLTLDWGFLDAPILKDKSQIRLPSPPKENDFQVRDKQALNESIKDDFEPGSNAWVISGNLTQSGKPLLASDPHLDLRVPNLWYRLGIRTPSHFIFGATIPGIPGIVIGRNDQVAWSFTNAAVDNVDQVIISSDSKEIKIREEEIPVKGKPSYRASFKDSPWGPVTREEQNQMIAVQWTALDPNNLKQLDLKSINQARNSSELLEALGGWSGPPQNAVFATLSGDIGWTIVGNVPKRLGFDGKSRSSWSKSIRRDGYIPRSEFPVVLNPPEGFIVSANQRSVPIGKQFDKFGYHWPNPARAKRIEDLLKQKRKWKASDFLEVQTDNLSLTHLAYRDLLLKCPLEEASEIDSAWLKPSYGLIKDWNGRTQIDSTAYPILKIFRNRLFSNLVGPISKTISESDKEIVFTYLSRDNLVFQLLLNKPKNFLSSQYSSYCELLIGSLLEASQVLSNKPELLSQVHWGDINRSDIQHPFGRLLPSGLQPLLSMPAKPLPGDSLVPQVMTPHNGVSMRLVIDFSNPDNSLFAQPGGQSGHPLSSHFSDNFDYWLDGKAVPFEPQIVTFREKFTPKRTDG